MISNVKEAHYNNYGLLFCRDKEEFRLTFVSQIIILMLLKWGELSIHNFFYHLIFFINLPINFKWICISKWAKELKIAGHFILSSLWETLQVNISYRLGATLEMLETLLATMTAKNGQLGIKIMITMMVEVVQTIMQDQDGTMLVIKHIHWG